MDVSRAADGAFEPGDGDRFTGEVRLRWAADDGHGTGAGIVSSRPALERTGTGTRAVSSWS